MSGAIIVEGLTNTSPELAKMKQRLIIVSRDGHRRQNAPPYPPGRHVVGLSRTDVRRPSSKPNPSQYASHADSGMASADAQRCRSPGHHDRARREAVLPRRQRDAATRRCGSTSRARRCSSSRSTASRSTRIRVRRRPSPKSAVIIPPAARAEFVVTGPRAAAAKFQTLCYYTGPDGDARSIHSSWAICRAQTPREGGDFSIASR